LVGLPGGGLAVGLEDGGLKILSPPDVAKCRQIVGIPAASVLPQLPHGTLLRSLTMLYRNEDLALIYNGYSTGSSKEPDRVRTISRALFQAWVLEDEYVDDSWFCTIL
jgi:hypothetical protein